MGRATTLGKERHARHAGSVTNKPQIADADPVGIAGELIFARRFHLDPKPILAAGADPGYDFTTHDGRTIDVKATNYRSPDGKGMLRVGLFADEGQVTADIYVLVYVDDVAAEQGRIMGWATKEELLAAPLQEAQKKGTGYKIRGHRLHRSKLRPIETLQVNAPGFIPAVRRTVGYYANTDSKRVPTIIEKMVIGGHSVKLYWNDRRTVAFLRVYDGEADYGIIIYSTAKRHGTAERVTWHIATNVPTVPYGRWMDAAEAAVRVAINTKSSLRTPVIPELPIDRTQIGLDFIA